ncbi:MAG: hypothetical protein ACJAZ1_003070 [Yoonia sp.]|jgi:hypothetical protein
MIVPIMCGGDASSPLMWDDDHGANRTFMQDAEKLSFMP